MNISLRERAPRTTHEVTRSREAAPTYMPEIVGFSEKQTAYIRTLLLHFGAPLTIIKRVRYYDRTKDRGVDSVEDNTYQTTAAASWSPFHKELVIAGPIQEHEGPRLARVMVHELGHAVFDPVSYVEFDEGGKPTFDEKGNVQFDPAVLEVFGSLRNVYKFEAFKLKLTHQAVETGKFLDGYQRMLAQRYHTLRAEVHMKAVRMSDPRNTPDENLQLQVEKVKLEEELEVILWTLKQESWSITMELAYLNPKALQLKTQAQKEEWERMGLDIDHQVLGIGEKMRFMETEKEAEYFLRLFLKTNAKGFEKKRTELRAFLLENPFPQD